MPYDVIFVGLATFLEETPGPGRRVMLPDGTNPPRSIDPDRMIEPHEAAIYVHRNRVLNASRWWASTEDQVLASNRIRVFPIKQPSLMTIASAGEADAADPFDETEFQNKIIRLKDLDPNLDLDPANAAAIGQIPIRRGKLVAHVVKSSIVARLTVASHTGAITVTATPQDGSGEKTLTLSDGTEMVIANVSRNLGAHSDNPYASHFRLYAQLDAQRRADNLVAPTDTQVNALGLTRLVSTHPYIRFLTSFGMLPETQCSVVGCCHC